MRKRIFSILLSVCMLLTLLPTAAFAVTREAVFGAFTVSVASDSVDAVAELTGDVLTITGDCTIKNTNPSAAVSQCIEVTAVANITLEGVNIDVSSTENAAAFKITESAGAVNLTLAGGSVNTLKSGKYCAGLQKDTTAEGTMLTIGGTGTLNATGGGFAAGIGGSNAKNGSYITFSGGTVNATGNGAGIGGGINASGSHIVISGGMVNAKGDYMCAGIGGGHGGNGNGSYITISGGTVTAEGGYMCVGIGAGADGASGNITISGGSVNAYCYTGKAISATPTNGQAISADVQLYTLTVKDAGNNALANAAISEISTTDNLGYTYGTTDVKTNANGKLYVYLPASKTDISVTANDVTYSGGVTSNAATLMPVLPTAAAYAAADPAAAPGTDYVLDTDNKTFTIKTAKGAAWWSANGDTYNDEYTVLLANDIDVSGFTWMPIGTYTKASDAIFDGQGHIITGLTVKIEAPNETVFAGMFGQFCGSIKNVGLVNASIVASNTSADNKKVYVGALAGDVFNGSISNCFVQGGSVSAASSIRSYVGGLVGYGSQGMVVRNCYSTADVTAEGTNSCSGGVIGTLNSGTVDNCYYLDTATVTGTDSNLGTRLPDAQMKADSGMENALIDRLNTWVKRQDSIDYYTWQADSGTTNGGYPVFDAKRTAPKAQWGAAGSDGSTPTNWTTGTLADAVEYANELSSGTAYIQLLEHVNIIATLEFDEGKTTVLDLNGKTIDGSSIPTSSSDNNVLTVNGNLTLCDTSSATVANQGKITGGHGTGDGSGGGVYVDDTGFFIMTGGNITGNTADVGGGVVNEGDFTMTGGSIYGNSCLTAGGGVENAGVFTMTGGSITGNTVANGGVGGGVLIQEGMTLSGDVNISGNTVGEASDNVALMPYGGHPSNIYITDVLTHSTAIGVSIVEMTAGDSGFVFTPKAGIFTAGDVVTNSAYISKFVSDNSGFAVIADGSQLRLAAAQAITKVAAANGSFTVKVNGNQVPSATEGQTVAITPTASSGYALDAISVCKTGDTNTAVTVTNGSFTMPDYGVTVSVTFKAVYTPPPGEGGTGALAGAPVIVDGKTQNIGTEKKSGDATTVTVDQSKLGENIGGAANGSSVVVPVSENGSATASLVVKNIEDMAQKGMMLTVQTGSVAYNLNTSAIDTAALEAAFPGADMSAVPFDVTITNSSAGVEGETLVLSPVTFSVTAAYGGKTVGVDTFSAYIDRVIEVTKEQAAKITTAVVVNADGSVRHVPTKVIEKDGKYYAVVSSRTNSTYALIQNEVTFADATGKWYEAAVNEMGSRKIITGRGADLFDGEASITRAEFASILIRALGLPADGKSTFSDVPTTAWYTGAVATAVKYGIVAGKGDNQYGPNANITRQEAMLMLQRTAALTGFTGTSGDLGSFADANSVGSWAQGAAKWSVGSGLIQGADGKLNPTANITRAESAAIILRLLQKAELVDVRSRA